MGAAAGAMGVESDADVNAVDKDGNTALHFAAIHNKRLIASMLMWGGVDSCKVNSKGNSALHEAAAADSQDVAYLIVENGGEASKNLKNEEGKVPLEVARE